ncbi:MAG: hypothetical protein IID63_00600 [candidate division Zixibacteria bacterium]|nr:hypothetical protein [candidate division Zixibacteria bacterium]
MRKIYLLLFVVAVFFTANQAWAATASLVELFDGTTYENVEFRVDKSYKVISFKIDGKKKNISFTDISRILDNNGEDVTARYLGKYMKTSQAMQSQSDMTVQKKEDWLGETDPIREKYNKPLWSVAFPISANFSIPAGSYYQGFKAGLGFSGEILISINRNLSLRGTVSKSGMQDDLEEIAPGFRIIDDNLKFNVWKYFISLQYSNGPNWSANKKMGLYGFGGIGAVSHKLTGAARIQDPATDSMFIIIGSGEGDSKLALTSGFGFVGLLSPSFGVEFGSTIDIIIVGTRQGTAAYDPYGNVQTALVMDFHIGLITFL